MPASKQTALFAIFSALSVVGASIKIPAGLTSLALDSAPALVAAALINPFFGAGIAFAGHLLSALLGGFPLGPFHLIISIEMFLLILLFGSVYQKGAIFPSCFLFWTGNTFLAPLPFIWLISPAFYSAAVPGLLIASSINIVIAVLLVPRLSSIWNKNKQVI
ncbi:ECF transporter S component [Alteribacillus sp. HJP-4]|uniref:ECF transporter S component n=1 Tax=Alteribacillus sp. HJP-4 TaxID=2775394 RepID=UPI0035CD2246